SFLYQVWKEKEVDPRALGGDQLAMALSSWNLLHGYLGDKAVRDDMIYMADYYLAHSLSPATEQWGNLPYWKNKRRGTRIGNNRSRARWPGWTKLLAIKIGRNTA
ncbi:MAG: hypothetical protein ACKV2V_18420, partial [Blastocatellia bacterium]